MGDRVDYAVLGAGPAGLTAAYVLGLRGASGRVFEANACVGGLARTVEFDGCRFDLGGHRFFTKLQPVEQLWEDLLGADLLTRPRLSRIYYRNRYLSYPFERRATGQRPGSAPAMVTPLPPPAEYPAAHHTSDLLTGTRLPTTAATEPWCSVNRGCPVARRT